VDTRAAPGAILRCSVRVRGLVSLNDRQRAVLARVAGGDDLAGAESGVKRSARVLQDRGLVAISRPGGQWRVCPTEAGTYCHEHGRYPERPTGRKRPERRRRHRTAGLQVDKSADPNSATRSEAPTPKRAAPHATAVIGRQRHAAASQLIDELVRRGRKLVPRPDTPAEIEWRRVIDFAKRHRMGPPATRIEKKRTDSGDLLIQLLDGYHANHPSLAIDQGRTASGRRGCRRPTGWVGWDGRRGGGGSRGAGRVRRTRVVAAWCRFG
jgi:hypothetical protein